MKKNILGLLAASLVTIPALAGPGGSSGGGQGAALTSSSAATATGGAGGAGGSGTGGAATGGSATGGSSTSTGGAATGGSSVGTGGSANGNSSNISVSLTNSAGSGTTGTDANGVYNSKATVDYGGSYTVKSAPTIAAPALTSTFSDTCMGSSSFGLSLVGFGATGGTTVVDDACVRRLDSREFRAMGMVDVALALLCQSAANRQAVEATGRACPSATPVSAPSAANNRPGEYSDPIVRRRMEQNANMSTVSAAPAIAATTAAAATMQSGPVDMSTAMAAPAVTAESGGSGTAEVAQGGGATASAVTQSQPEVTPLQDAATAVVTGEE